jgi:hypothetical protein
LSPFHFSAQDDATKVISPALDPHFMWLCFGTNVFFVSKYAHRPLCPPLCNHKLTPSALQAAKAAAAKKAQEDGAAAQKKVCVIK